MKRFSRWSNDGILRRPNSRNSRLKIEIPQSSTKASVSFLDDAKKTFYPDESSGLRSDGHFQDKEVSILIKNISESFGEGRGLEW